MATGEKKWSAKGRKVSTMKSEPLPKGEYTFKFLKRWEVKAGSTNPKASGLPRVSGMFEALDTAANEGGKNRVVYHDIYLDTSNGSDGVSMVDRGGGLTNLCQVLGKAPDFALTEALKRVDGGKKRVVILKGAQVAQFLNNLDGETVKGVIKHERGLDKVERHRIEEFLLSEEEGEESEDEEGIDEDAEESDDAEEADEVDIEEEPEEDAEIEEDEDEAEDAEDDIDSAAEPDEEEEAPAPKKKVKQPGEKKAAPKKGKKK